MDRDAGLTRLAGVAVNPSIEVAVESARELLGMDVAYATEFTETDQLFKVLRGDGESFGVHEGVALPLDQTYCRRVLGGEIPGVVGDVRGNPVAAKMPITDTADVGSFMSVPLTFSDGTFYGTLCAASHGSRDDLGDREHRFLEVFARMIADQIERDLMSELKRDLELSSATAEALATALDARDSYTGTHSRAVVERASTVAFALGLDPTAVKDVEHVALLHDIGKIAIPDEVLQKPNALDEDEWGLMREHPVHGARLVAEIPGLGHLAPAVRAEHERWDGTGYPDGLAGDEIPLASRIVFVCDAYHAMRSDRPYRKAMTQEEAIRQLEDNIGSQFCPTAGRALLATVTRTGGTEHF